MATEKIAKRGISIYIDGQQVENSVRAIKASMRKLINEQANATIGSEKYVAAGRKIAQLEAILQEHKDNQAEITKQYSKMGDAAQDFEKKSGGLWGNIKSSFDDAKGAIVAFLASITVDRVIDDFALLDDAQANVRKYTGMTVEEVKDLNAEMKKMDTRTARIALNEFAADAGRLGIQGKKDILEFVEGANILNVALGEDLGEGAVKSIGKLAQMFGDADKMGLKQAMLSTGSAINEVAQNSSAAEPYLVDFSNRLSGVGVQAGYSIAQIIGLGSVLDQNAQQVEMSATALSGLIMKLYQEPAKFAKIAGLDVKDFTQLLKKDANEALLTLLDTLGKKGGLSELAPIFNEMKLDGARAASVLSVLAGNISNIRKEQATATRAFKEGTSAINEYDVQNNTFSANLAKSKQVLQNYIYELGERLSPYVLDAAHAGGSLIKMLSILTTFLFNNGKAILTVAGAIVAYNAGLQLTELWNKRVLVAEKANLILSGLQKRAFLAKLIVIDLYNGRMSLATARTEFFNLVLKMNPLGAFLAIITAVAAGLYLYSKRTEELTQLQKSHQKINKKVNDEYDSQRSKIDVLVDTLNNEKIALNQRREALDELKKIMPDYKADLTDEGVLINNNTEAIKAYLVQLEQQIRMKAAQEELEELYRQKRQQEKEAVSKQNIADNAKGASVTPISGQSPFAGGSMGMLAGQAQVFADRAKKELANTEDAITSIRDEIQKGMEEAAKLSSVVVEGTGGGGGGGGKSDKSAVQRKKLQDALKQLEEDHLKAMSAIKESYLKDDLKTEFEYNQELLNQQDKYDENRKAKLESLKKELTDPSIRIDIAKQIADIDSKNLDRQIQQANKIKKILLDADPIEQEKQSHENRLRELGLFNDDVTKRTEAQKTAVELLEKQHADNMRKLSRKDANLQLKQLDTLQADAERVLSERKVQEKMSEHQFNDEKLKIEADFLKRKLQINGLSLEKAEEIQKQITNNLSDQVINKSEARESILDKYGIRNVKDQKEAELAVIRDFEDKNIITHEEALKIKAKIDQEYLQSFVDKASQVNEIISRMGGNLSGTMSNYQSAEESAVSRKYDKQIAAAEGNSKKQKKLEEKKQKELNAIRAKYADKQFIVTVAQTISSTALAAMEAYKAMAGIPVVGPALGIAAAAAALAYGGSQIAVAKEQRDAAKEGYFAGGYTGGTDPKEVRGYFPDGSPYHGDEFVANHKSTANGLLRPLFDVIDDAQRNNTVSSLSKRDLAKALRISGPGFYDGGYRVTAVSEPAARDTRYNESYGRFVDVMERLEARLEVPLKAGVTITGDDGIEHQMNLYNKMKRDATR